MAEINLFERLRQTIASGAVEEIVELRPRRVFLRVHYHYFKDVIVFLKNSGYSHLSAITGQAIDDSIEILYHLDKAGELITVRVSLPSNKRTIPTITDVITGASLYEREIHDLFGVVFEGHPCLEKLILPDDWKN